MPEVVHTYGVPLVPDKYGLPCLVALVVFFTLLAITGERPKCSAGRVCPSSAAAGDRALTFATIIAPY